jgi:hypothetical protein
MSPINSLQALRRATVVLAMVAASGLATAKAVPGDGALPVVELMPLTMKHEADLKLNADQIKSLDDYRKQAAPGRIAVQKKIIDLRGQLRMAILDNRPAPDREALMKQIADAEVEHFKGRDRCVEHVRKTLDAAQYQQLVALYLGGLR